MSAMIKVLSELSLCGYPPGEWFLFNSKYIFQELFLDNSGRLFLRNEDSDEEWFRCYDTDILRLNRGNISISLKITDGEIYGSRIYSDFAWEHRIPEFIFAEMKSVKVCILYARLKELLGDMVDGYGLSVNTDISQGGVLNISPVHNGWILLKNDITCIPVYIRNNHIQLIGRIEDGYIVSPITLGENHIGNDELFSACLIKPDDYLDYGGEVIRWGNNRNDPDCSWGCKFFKALHGEECDWGVCTNPSAQRCGLLTFEHQSGLKCFRNDTD